MAEVFSVGASIVGVIGLTIQVAQIISQFGLDWKDAPSDVKSFISELQGLKATLSQINSNLLLNKDFDEAFQGRPSALLRQLSGESSSSLDTRRILEDCRYDLEGLLNELKTKTKKHHVTWERLKWPLFTAQKTQKTVHKLHRQCQIFNSMISIDSAALGAATHNEVIAGRKEQQKWYEARMNQKILAWISRMSFEDTHKDVLSKRHPGTGQWLTASEIYRQWEDDSLNKSSTLWCPGIPGAGKSVMASFIIDHLKSERQTHQTSVSYIYCDYKDRRNQTALNLMSSLVKQLVLQHNIMPEEVERSYSKHGNGIMSLSLEDCSELLRSTIDLFATSFIIIDALDQHLDLSKDADSSTRMIKLITQLRSIQGRLRVGTCCKLFVTSRENRLIEEQLSGCTRIDIRATDSDIREYLRSQVLDVNTFHLAESLQADDNLNTSILDMIAEKADGMFLLPRLHVEYLASQSTVRKLREAITTLPNGLDNTYDNAMARIEAQLPAYRELATKILSWISYTTRPLRVEELRHALAVQVGDREFDHEGIESETLLVTVCAGLVTIDDKSQTIRLVHYTVEEYFEKNKKFRFPNAKRDIAKTLLTYLAFDVFADMGFLYTKTSKISEVFPLFDYAAQYWAYCTADAQDDTIDNLAVRFLADDLKAQIAGQVQLRTDCITSVGGFYGLHLAAYVGIRNLVDLLIVGGADPNSVDSMGRSPLAWAASKGHTEVVKLILAIPGVDADSKDVFNSTPMYLAAQRGHVEIVKELLAIKPIAINQTHGTQKQTLSSESDHNDEGNISLPELTNNVSLSTSIFSPRDTPLSKAVRHGHFEIVKLLLGNAIVDRNLISYVETPLLLAIKKGHIRLATMLLAAGADPIIANKYDEAPLTCALDGGYMDLVDTLLTAGARPKVGDIAFEEALRRAINRKDVTVTKQVNKGILKLLYRTSKSKRAIQSILQR